MSSIMLMTADPELSKQVKQALRDTPARITVESAVARTAPDIYAKAVPNLVIVDYFIPESTGLEVIKSIKRVNETCLFIFLSRVRNRSVLEKAFRLGAHDLLILPVSDEVLKDTVLYRLEAQPLQDAEVPADAAEQASAKPGRKK